MSKEYLFTVHSYRYGDDSISHPVEVELSCGRTLKAVLPAEVASELNRLITDWVKAEEKIARSSPVSLEHHDCCSCGSCGVTEFADW